jgi:hypothetical protein
MQKEIPQKFFLINDTKEEEEEIMRQTINLNQWLRVKHLL